MKRRNWKHKKTNGNKEIKTYKEKGSWILFSPRVEAFQLSMISKLGVSEVFLLVFWGKSLLHLFSGCLALVEMLFLVTVGQDLM